MNISLNQWSLLSHTQGEAIIKAANIHRRMQLIANNMIRREKDRMLSICNGFLGSIKKSCKGSIV